MSVYNRRISRQDRLFYMANDLFLLLILLAIIYPLIYVVSASFSSPNAVVSGRVWLFPVNFSLDGYKAVFASDSIMTGYANTLFYTVTGTVISVILTIAAAYPLARRDFKPRNIIMLIFAFTMFFGGGIIPTYILVKNLGMLDTRWALILPQAMSVFNVIIARTYFQSTPSELLEAAQIDGCSDIRYLVSVLLPLSKPIIAVLALFYSVSIWNSYFDALMYTNRESLWPLTLVLRDILVANSVNMSMMQNVDIDTLSAKIGLSELLKYSLIIVSTVPLLIIYPFIQRYFVKGVMIGAIKG
ncbi:carbohydrate ABC transporter permease [Paenibacillus contaminans]|uniref:Carbohydrate ABC transporter permease n=1 Tax=Paenibacillus contaminans TaxID=450362 RepID=A0A329MT72_9BACL|nr:carbohydrate ABC transporter permease [Paenibacillus contaminans]RAV23189.1 carbohydrate ABC transporter permease [Paenibacillus contaminans]